MCEDSGTVLKEEEVRVILVGLVRRMFLSGSRFEMVRIGLDSSREVI